MSDALNPHQAINGDVCCEKCRRPIKTDGVTWARNGTISGFLNAHCEEHGTDMGRPRVWTGENWYPSDEWIAFEERYSR